MAKKKIDTVEAPVKPTFVPSEDFDLNFHVYRLLVDEPFFAALSRRITKTASTAIPTAGVRINEETAQFEMIYNPKFMNSLCDVNGKMLDNHVRGVLMHEFYHLVFDHVSHRKPDDKKLHKMWNIAADLAINCHIGEKNLPEWVYMPGVGKFKNYPPFLSAEKYFKMLQQDPEMQSESGEGEGEGEGGPSQGNGNGQFDSHDGWDDCDPAIREMAKQTIEEFIEKSTNECLKSQSWGTLSNETRESLIKRMHREIDWKKVMRNFIGNAQRAEHYNTHRRINRKFPYIHPGRRTSHIANVAVAIDQSGSVSDEMLSMFFSELDKLAELATFTVVPFDDRVFKKKIYKWKKGERRKAERVLNGGTNFDSVVNWLKTADEKYDGVIMLTDGYAPVPKAAPCRRIWLIPESCRNSLNTPEIKVYVGNC